MSRLLATAALVLALALPQGAGAAGFGRPNLVGAPAIGMGGAYAAIADDASAIYHNPAGISLIPQTSLLLDIGVVIPDRQYQPADCTVTAPDLPGCAGGATTRRNEREMMTPMLVPALAFSTRFGKAYGEGASRLAIGFAAYQSYGDSIRFSDKLSGQDRPGVRSTRISLIELVPAVAYQASDYLAVGAGLRIGVGLFDLDSVTMATSPELTGTHLKGSSVGVTAGANLGVMVRPTRWLNLAFVYRTPMKVPASGDLNEQATPIVHHSLNVDLPFPQQFTIGASVKPIDRLRLAVQVDWTNWSSFDHLTFKYQATSPADVYLNFKDTWTAHVGGEFYVTAQLPIRLGYALETAAVPDVSMERQWADALRHTVSVGAGYVITKRFRIDAAFEYQISPQRDVAVSDPSVPALLQNAAPGSYKGSAYQAMVTGQFRY
jgi:long-chain fatty acid transport protein